MRKLNFGSLNLDIVYTVPRFAAPGETLAASRMANLCDGKGLNQSIAMARAGGQVWHARCVGASDGGILVDEFERSGVDTSLIRRLDCPTGHAVIQVDQTGHNSILLMGSLLAFRFSNQLLPYPNKETVIVMDSVLFHSK